MKKRSKIICLAAILSLSFANFVYAQDIQIIENNEMFEKKLSLHSDFSNKTSDNNPNVSESEINNIAATNLVAPVVEDPKLTEKKKTQPKSSTKIDLRAIMFDPNADFDAQAKEEGREMTKAEEVQYNLHEALHGEVSKLSTKGLLADKMKIKFENGPIDNISPWIDYNGYFSNMWTNSDYKNTLYTINYADVGFNINMKDNKTFARVMFSPVKTYEGRNYFQTFFADNYITRKVSKNNTILVGRTWLPLGFEGKESPLIWQFFNRSQLSLNYSAVRTNGIKAMGNYKYADYHLGVYSAGHDFTDWFPGLETAGWVEFKPLANLKEKYGKLTIGTGFNVGNSNSHYAVGMGAINYEYKRFRSVTEFGLASGSNGALGFTSSKSRGINETISYRVTPRLQAVARYDQFDPNTEKANNLRREYTVGLNYFIKDYAARLMLNYIFYNLENGTYGSRILVGTQIIL